MSFDISNCWKFSNWEVNHWESLDIYGGAARNRVPWIYLIQTDPPWHLPCTIALLDDSQSTLDTMFSNLLLKALVSLRKIASFSRWQRIFLNVTKSFYRKRIHDDGLSVYTVESELFPFYTLNNKKNVFDTCNYYNEVVTICLVTS